MMPLCCGGALGGPPETVQHWRVHLLSEWVPATGPRHPSLVHLLTRTQRMRPSVAIYISLLQPWMSLEDPRATVLERDHRDGESCHHPPREVTVRTYHCCWTQGVLYAHTDSLCRSGPVLSLPGCPFKCRVPLHQAKGELSCL